MAREKRFYESQLFKYIIEGIKWKLWQDNQIVSNTLKLIKTHKEDYYYDFKEKWHEHKADLLHDILCLANNTQNRSAFLIFGINDSLEIVGLKKM